MDELAALEKGDIQAWAEILSDRGDLMPTDNTILDNMFHLRRMRTKRIPMPLRIESRTVLMGRGVVENEPLTVLERLSTMDVRNQLSTKVAEMLKGADEVILIYPDQRIRSRSFLKVTEELGGHLDIQRSSVNKLELYTLDNKHIKFLLDNEDYDIPDKKIALRTINSAL